jgi:hypothetical protein
MENYEWQRQYTRQRIDTLRREADAHRLVNQAPGKGPRRNPLAAVLRAFIGLFPARRRSTIRYLFHSEEQT